MRARCIREFRDFANGRSLRRVGEEFDVTPERLKKLNSTRYGNLVEAVETPAEAAETAPAARKTAAAKKGTANRRTARKSAQED